MATYPTTGSQGWAPTLEAYIDSSMKTQQAFAPGDFNFFPTTASGTVVIGIDTVNDALYARDDANGIFRMCTAVDSLNRPITWTASKGLPSGVTWDNLVKLLTFGGNLYMLAIETASGLPKIYKAAPQTGATTLTWSAALKAGTTGSLARMTNFTTDGTYLYFAEYGDPVGGPSLYRSSDGTSWSTVKTFTGYRHIHVVRPDPYNPGSVWVALGDGLANQVQYSANSGSTWSNHAFPMQVADLSFATDGCYGADDGGYVSAAFMGRDGTTWQGIAGAGHLNSGALSMNTSTSWDPPSIANGATTSTTVSWNVMTVGIPLVASLSLSGIPAGMQLSAISDYGQAVVSLTNHSGGTVDLGNSTLIVSIAGTPIAPAVFYGTADPSQGVYYFQTQQESSHPLATLWAMLRHGQQPALLDVAPFGNSEMFIWHGRLFYGGRNRAALTVAA